MGRFEKLIRETLKRHRLPQDLIYVAMIESGFNPRTLSYAGASGLWQFMPLGGRIYGLNSNYWLDERRNPERSTVAAMVYLKDLHDRFRDWHLALAAYNAGYAGVIRAVRKYNTNDYWKLSDMEAGLPYGTTNYIPKLLAVAVAGHNRKLFALNNVVPDPPYAFEVVTVRGAPRLGRIARAAGVPYKDVLALNPELRRRRVPPGYASFQVRLPKGAGRRFMARAVSMGLTRPHLKVYTVRYGDDPKGLARRFGVSPGRLRRFNALRTDSELRPGLQILIPRVRQPKVPAKRTAAARPRRTPVETEKPIAAVPVLKSVPPVSWRQVFYRTRPGDKLGQLAALFHVTQQQLVRWNNLNPRAVLVRGMLLMVFVPPGTSLKNVRVYRPREVHTVEVGSREFHRLHLSRRGKVRIVYTVRRRDTIKRIARRFRLSVGSIARQNKISRRAKLRRGQKIVLYVDRSFVRRRRLRRRRRYRGRRGPVTRRRPAVRMRRRPVRTRRRRSARHRYPSHRRRGRRMATVRHNPRN
jgi:membrane-bound lytic murein transglycosylase D